MELSLIMRLRIAAAAAVGIILIGIFAWPLAEPIDPFAAVSLFAGDMSAYGAIALAGLALLTGLLAYFAAWPYGRQIGILAVPSGLAIWAIRTGSVANLVRLNPTVTQRQDLFAALRWEPVYWLAVVAVGFLGVLLGQKISQQKSNPDQTQQKPHTKSDSYVNAAIALIGTVLIAKLCLAIFAQDIRIFDEKLGSVIAQPAIGQVVFAVLISFGISAFVVKKFFDISYIWPIAATALLPVFVSIIHVKQNILQHLAQSWPAVFFSNVTMCILPVQMVAFGTLGSIAGYWLAVRYNYWRKHDGK